MLNKQLLKIDRENCFSKSNRIIAEYKAKHPDKKLISLGIGDVSFPVARPIIDAMKQAAEDLAEMESFQGYGAYYGIESLRKAICENEYKSLGIDFDEIYVGDGTKTDSTSVLELFDAGCSILVGNPTYPIYENGAYALSRNVSHADCDDEFKMLIPKEHFDIVYICSPSNPAGYALSFEELSDWVSYARKENSILVYDNAYKDFIRSENVPQSIYEIPGSKECCIELRTFSKNISFSGTRCSYMVLPKELGEEYTALWKERTINRFNGACYIAQKGAEASFLPEVQSQIRSNIDQYRRNADYLLAELSGMGFKVLGGIDAPYIFMETPGRVDCWEAFELFLEKMNIITIPGSIFGSNASKMLRLSALGKYDDCVEAVRRIKEYYGNEK